MKSIKISIILISLCSIAFMEASVLYVFNGLYGRSAKLTISHPQSRGAQVTLKQYEQQRIGTISNTTMLDDIKIDVEATPSRNVSSSTVLTLRNILSGPALQKAKMLFAQNKDIYLNLQEKPGANMMGINVLSEPLYVGRN